MRRTTTIYWLSTLGAIALTAALATTLGPVRITIAIQQGAEGAGAAVADIPTATPQPPTATAAPSVTAAAPTATAAPTAPPPTPTPATPPTDVPPATELSHPPAQEPARRRTPTPAPTTPPEPAMPLPAPDLRIEKRADPGRAAPGTLVRFSLRVTNAGPGAAHDVVVSDIVPAPLTVVDLESSKGDIVVERGQVTAFPRELQPGEAQVYTVVARLAPDTPPGELSNTAVVTTSDPDRNPGDNTSTARLVVAGAPQPQRAPALPRTSDPRIGDGFLSVYWPLVALAFGALAFAAALRGGALRAQTLRVTVGLAGAPPPSSTVDLTLDAADLVARWRAGAPLRAVADIVERRNPAADRAAIVVALRRLLERAAQGGG